MITSSAGFERGVFAQNICHADQPSLEQVIANCEHRAISSGGGFGYTSILEGADISLLEAVVLAHWACANSSDKKKVQKNKLVTVYYISPTPQGKAGKGNTMAEFEAITTQEAFDNAIKARLDRNTDTVKKQFEGYISPDDFKTKTADLNGKITDLTGKLAEKDTTIADLTAKNKAYETSSVKMRIAHETDIPYELANKLSGDTEEAIQEGR